MLAERGDRMSKNAEFFVVRKGATAVPNSLIHDKTLSYQALALALVSLSMPAGSKVGYRQLAGRGMGEAATRKGLLELEQHHLRFRFRTRREGKIRDLTVVSDVPLSILEAYAEIIRRVSYSAMGRVESVACVSHPQELGEVNVGEILADDSELSTDVIMQRLMEYHRAATGTARYDQHKQPQNADDPGEEQPESGEYPQAPAGDGDAAGAGVDKTMREPGGTQGSDQQKYGVCAGRTVPRSTVARSTTAHISKDISKPSLRDGNTNQTRARPGGVVGSSPTGQPSAEPAEGSLAPVTHRASGDHDDNRPPVPAGGASRTPEVPPGSEGAEASKRRTEMILAALPEGWVSMLGRAGRERALADITGLVQAGWTPAQIRTALKANPLPPRDQIRNPAGLIIHRLADLVGQAPARSVRETRQEWLARAVKDLTAIAQGCSQLPARDQFLRANALADRYDIYQDPRLRELAQVAVAQAQDKLRESSGHVPSQSRDEPPQGRGRSSRSA